MAPDSKPCGVTVVGTNPLAVDSVCAALMGFDWTKIKMLAGAFSVMKKAIVGFKHEDIIVKSDDMRWDKPLGEFRSEDSLRFNPHFGWVGAIELKSTT